ncbi:hypothetical protein JXA02_02400 [candidate division KSB1 bacterium]|nr:hypothetical protein [candidate division KSB1 bacterium]RQW10205.1 MAG: hypothetical protein EH222_02625 [candidate division KSB1 bacterium]
MPFAKIEPEQVRVFPLASRKSKSAIEAVAIDPTEKPAMSGDIEIILRETAQRIRRAREKGASVILAFGAHLIKNGLGLAVIELMKSGWVTHIATNGAGGIHDWEFAWLGRSEEDVRANVATGTFGTWEETGKYINLAVQTGALADMGYGESLGALIDREELSFPDPSELDAEMKSSSTADDLFLSARVELLQTMRKFQLAGRWRIAHPYKKYSVLGHAFELGIPATIHPGIGYDIIYLNPYANGAALGRAAHTDFKIMVNSVANLSHGVFLSVGSAVMAPQIFEKALSFANNIKIQAGDPIVHDHCMVVNDLQQGAWDWQQGEPPRETPDYYFRFLKSFYRMGGAVHYVAADNRTFLLNLYHLLISG